MKVVDVEPYLEKKKGFFVPLRDPDFFRLVQVIDDTLVWPNEADFCPDVLYEIGIEVKDIPEEIKKSPPTSEKPRAQNSPKSKR